MTRTIEVEVRFDGSVHSLTSATALPTGKAYLTWTVDSSPEPEDEWAGVTCLQLSEAAFSDWLDREEDEAWAHLQPVK